MRTKSKPISKKQQVLNYLQRYGSINRMTALTNCKDWNLSTTVATLRKQGHDIKTDGKRHGVKYILYKNGEPVFNRFLKV